MQSINFSSSLYLWTSSVHNLGSESLDNVNSFGGWGIRWDSCELLASWFWFAIVFRVWFVWSENTWRYLPVGSSVW